MRAVVVCVVVALAGLSGCGRPGGGPPEGVRPPVVSVPAPVPIEGQMDEDRFWSLVEGTTWDGPEQQAALVRLRLSELPAEDLLAYEKRRVDLSNGILTWRHLAAAEVVMGFTSEDAFTDLRTWVMFQGRDVYTDFRSDPDSLAGRGPTDDEQLGAAEDLEFLALDVYRARTGTDMLDLPDYPLYLHVPSGEPIDESNAALARRYPKLAARYMRGVDPDGSPADGPRAVS
ncbi:DUF4240 domain-containing protein [Kineosporia sp. A_224]|uniref:DUF4240 domain-containing protein n=1 Tax=Kineosporia sp. A_224 TaxID=1962180 RepID=UPI000B4A5CF6|nr:DUF4240 domain-containing protein [Kineosporia sp. A_224]